MKNRKFKIRNITFFILPIVLLLAGCEEKKQIKPAGQKAPALSQKDAKVSKKDAKANQKAAEEKKVAEDVNSAGNCARLAAENKQLKEQVETLMGIGKQIRVEALSTLTAIELTNRGGVYDKNNDKKKEMLVVYLKPIDDMGDVVKAAGAVEIELWDLNAKSQEAFLKSWQIEPKDLKKKWSGSLLTSYYKLQLDANSVLTGKEKELTIKAQFTDYLTGKVLKAQKVINSK